MGLKSYYATMRDAFSLRFLGFLLCTQLFLKGTMYQIANSMMLPIFKTMNVDAAHVQLFNTLASSPWSIKPLVGVLSDLLILRGYHKRYYLVQSMAVGILAAIALCIIPQEIAYSLLIVVCFFALNYEISIADLMSEGAYARLMREQPHTGSNIVTLVNAFSVCGTLLALSFIGPLSDESLFVPVFAIGAVLALTPLIPTLLGWLPEPRIPADVSKKAACIKMDWDVIRNNKLPFAIVACTGLSGPILAVLTIYVSHIVGIVCAVMMIGMSVAGAYIAFPKMIGHVALYQIIVKLGKPSLGSAMDFFFTADEQCVPGGPGFSFKYYITYTGILGAVVSLLATWIYSKWMSKWRFRSVLIFTSVLVAAGGLSDLLIVLRVNIALGIPDKVSYVLGEAILESVVGMLYWIPSSAIISKVCPENMEATTYAFLAGISNFGGMTSSMLGAIIFKAAGIQTTRGNCDFDSLWWLILVFHILLPLVSSVSASFLIPNKYQTESLVDDDASLIVLEMVDDFDLDTEFVISDDDDSSTFGMTEMVEMFDYNAMEEN
jgi:hypothetical protein